MSDHEWCRDVSRDESVRRAEDAAAVPSIQHRDLPAAVEALMERVGKIEAAMIPKSVSGSDAEVPENKGGTMLADGLRTERVTLEVTHRRHTAHEWAWPQMICLNANTGESVRVVEDRTGTDMGNGVTVASMDEVLAMAQETQARLAAERDAAIRERDEARAEAESLQATVAILERRYLRCVGLRDADGDAIAELKDKRDALTARVAELERERDEARAKVAEYEKTRQWNIEKIEDGCIRVCFGDHHRAADCEWEYFIPASREADLQNQRSGAIRERDAARADLATLKGECESIRDRVAELEAAKAASAGGEKQEPVAWGVVNQLGKRIAVIDEPPSDGWGGCTVVPLYAAPPEPRGWLTAEERRAVANGVTVLHQLSHFELSLALRSLLDRSTPPMVKVPSDAPQHRRRDDQWIAAIREAGGEVAE